ncbi:flagellar biosynthesis anti-sigma factor FlgM [Caminibacter pacificus]
MIRKISIGFKTFVSTQQNETKKTQKNQEVQKLSRVEEIKQQIQKGEYKIDLRKTAEAMAKALLF